ncbi:MAG: DUF86 domain-containing protein [Acidobacteria bacterium]|nr:DUF86 domain-containing protein [Acidobacteriota bacterium]MBV9067511.1 DUF86 domain-containing protein [Acidobacteriota bacterium]MBV9185203.1 DUF86 domain-containing protein [Acidobacteriota bacterium]
MLTAAKRVRGYAAGLTRAMFDASDRDQDAIVRRLEVIGEAARQVSKAFQQEHPEIPWPTIIGMRHRLAHDYRNVDFDVVWETVQQKIPALIVELERFVIPDTPERPLTG